MSNKPLKILIQCGNSLDNRERIKPLALILKAMGHTPYALVYNKEKQRFFNAHGIETVSLYDEIDDSNKGKFKRLIMQRLISIDGTYKLLSLPDIYQFDLLKLGTKKWNKKDQNKHVRHAVRHIDVLDKIIKRNNINYLFVWNGFTGIVANILRCYAFSRKIPHAYMERGCLPKTLFIDHQGTNGASHLSDLTEKSMLPQTLKRNDIIKIISKTKDISDFEDVREKNKAKHFGKKKKQHRFFIPLQVQDDTNIILYAYLQTMRAFILAVYTSYVSQNINSTKMIVRPHPEEDEKQILNIPDLPAVTFSSEGNLYDQILESTLTFTLNSTVGLEAAMFGTPTITIGKGIYTGKGFTFDATTETLNATIDQALNASKATLNKKDEQFFSFMGYMAERNLIFEHILPKYSNLAFSKINKLFEKSFAVFGYKYTQLKRNDEKDVLDFNTFDHTKEFIQIKKLIHEGYKVPVILHTSPNEVLNLTYRKTTFPTDRNYVIRFLNTFFQTQQNDESAFSLFSHNDNNAPKNPECAVEIFSESSDVIHPKYKNNALHIDLYGTPFNK